MTQYFHGGRKLVAHSGLCLTEDFDAALAYSQGRGDTVHAVDMDLDGLTVRHVKITREMVDSDSYPGDTARERAALIAEGVDVLTYDDCDPNGRTSRTIRLISDAALALVVDAYEVE